MIVVTKSIVSVKVQNTWLVDADFLGIGHAKLHDENSTPSNDDHNDGNEGNEGNAGNTGDTGNTVNDGNVVNDISDSDLLAVATEVSPSTPDQQSGEASGSGETSNETSGEVSGETSDEASSSRVLNSQGFLAKQMSVLASLTRQMASIPNPPGPKSTQDSDPNDLSADQPENSPDDQPVNSSADQPANSSADQLANSSADQPASSPADPPVDSPVIDLTTDSSPDLPPARKSTVCSSSRRKPAPMPPALDALSRRPTRPTLAVAGKSTASHPSRSSTADGG